ncbi:hypothetical protein GE061_017487 [Apolygus lucorum]|uniref:Zinc finger PHD-type domain-containing protein n=1 Tax=Apolygus lucorum TaxID=248454 RepID=A0A8S9XDA3_APOLU|nr:hypothetical protein GE061_017487 [Apolygus lucorum]
MDCAKCSRDLFSPKKTVKCVKCESSYHPSCTRLKSVENFRKLRKEARERWECDRCKGLEEVSSEDEDSLDGVKEVASKSESTRSSAAERAICDVNRKLDKLSSVAGDMRELKESVGFMSTQFDTFMEEMSKLKTTVDELHKENNDLKSVVRELQQKVDYLEQDSRNNNVELHGIPETNGESCVDIVKQVSNFLKVECGSITNAFRVGIKKDRPRKILAVLKSPDDRENLVRSAKADKSLTARLLYKEWPNDRVFVNENLTAFRAELFRRAKAKAKDVGMKFVWLKNFVVHVRRAEGDRVRTIRSFDDIDRM